MDRRGDREGLTGYLQVTVLAVGCTPVHCSRGEAPDSLQWEVGIPEPCEVDNAPKTLQGAERIPESYWRQEAVAGMLASLEITVEESSQFCERAR